MEIDQEQQNKKIYVNKVELEEGAKELSQEIIRQYRADISVCLLDVACSIAISLKKIAEEANMATANMNVGVPKAE